MTALHPNVNEGVAGRLRAAGVPLALIMGFASVLIQAIPPLNQALQWNRANADASAVWRWVTGHLTHWSWNHLLWDLGAFALLSAMTLRLEPEHYARCVGLAAALIPLELRVHQPQFASYRGLSGLDCALFGLMVAGLWRQGGHWRNPAAPRWLGLAGGCAFLAKTIFELRTGGTLFVSNEQRDFLPVVSAHLTGFAAGLAAAASGSSLRQALGTWGLRFPAAPR